MASRLLAVEPLSPVLPGAGARSGRFDDEFGFRGGDDRYHKGR
jgi:hypothetical protein